MSDTWKQWEGQIVNGEFPLLQYLGGSEHRAVFLTERREDERLVKAAVRLVAATPENGELQLSRWRQAAELLHPHLVRLYEIGRCELGGVPLLYVVMECAEENLAQVLLDRALTPAEARAMIESVVDVLAYLHGKGFVHGHIKPGNIMASGDQLKVSSDELHRTGEPLQCPGNQDLYDPPEIARGVIPLPQTLSPAGDVWSLGMTLVETLTQNLPVVRTAEQLDPLIPQTLPEPFLDIVRHCLVRHPQERWTVSEIAARLQGRIPAAQVRAVLRAPQSAVSRSSSFPVKGRSYGIPLAAGIIFAFVAIVAGPRLLHRHSEMPPDGTALLEQPTNPSEPRAEPRVEPKPEAKQVTPAQPEHRSETSKAASISKPGMMKDQIFEGRTATPALAHPESLRGKTTDTVAMLPAAGVVHGDVAQRVLPEVLESARNTIRGTVKVAVRVDVDRSGDVESAELESYGPSKYFARTALEAAQLWRFKPPMVGGRGVLSTWTLRFEFTRGGTIVVPAQEIP